MDQPSAVPFGIHYLEQLPNMGYDILDKSKSSMGPSRGQDGQMSASATSREPGGNLTAELKPCKS